MSKPKRCKHWIVINEPDMKDAFCVGGHGYTVYVDCRGYMKKECGWYEEREEDEQRID